MLDDEKIAPLRATVDDMQKRSAANLLAHAGVPVQVVNAVRHSRATRFEEDSIAVIGELWPAKTGERASATWFAALASNELPGLLTIRANDPDFIGIYVALRAADLRS